MPTLGHTSLLRTHMLRATDARLAILLLLTRHKKPMSIGSIVEKLEHDGIHKTTVYRSAESMEAAGLLQRVELRHGHVDFEINLPETHHEHLICTSCGKATDIPHHGDQNDQSIARAHGFAHISGHSMTYWGTCNSCARNA